MNRRNFLKSTAAITGGGMLAGYDGLSQSNAGPEAVPGPKPNILFILVDELRYPTVFPDGIKTPGEFLARFMPNIYKLWQAGVKFGEYHNAANACTPSRGVMITGLYSQQNWLLTTILSTPYPPGPPSRQPVLNHNYPTFGKLLRANGYQTPYTGKWHVSIPQADKGGLENYGFDFFTYYDPTGDNLQGTYGDEIRGYHNDSYSAGQGANWLLNQRPKDQPWCLTVSLINPHDREFFPAGTEFKTVTDLFDDRSVNTQGLNQMAKFPGNGPNVSWQENALKHPPSYKYPDVPPNWENEASLNAKNISTQIWVKEFQEGIWGGIAEDPSQDTATIEQYPNRNPNINQNLGVVKMPYSYWKRGLDSYTQVMQIVDNDIGGLMSAFYTLPKDVVENTVIVFAADHGEYAGAHGLVQGKMATCYEEAWHIPLIVVDPSGRFTGETNKIRNGLTSSVDLFNLLVSIGYKGTKDWMQGYLADIYGDRHDMISMLRSADAPGRPYVLFATDEIVPGYFIFNRAPTHVLGLRMEDTKLGVYEKWIPPTSHIIPGSIELEFYDYTTPKGVLELENIANKDPRAYNQSQTLLNDIVPNELQEILPPPLTKVQQASKAAHLLYRQFIALQPSGAWKNGGLQTLLGYGRMF